MGIFKNIKNTYRVLKTNKQLCCKNIDDMSNQLHLSMDDSCKNKKIELMKKYEKMFEDYKNNTDYVDKNALYNYCDNKISKEEYEMKDMLYKQKVKQAIEDVNEGKMSHENFFEIIFSIEK